MFALGYAGGRRGSAIPGNIEKVPTDILHYYMHFNGSFAQRQNKESDAAWAALFPEKKGFVRHELAPNVAGLAVFHELHCLNIIRKAFWASVDGNLDDMGSEYMEQNRRTSHAHIRHSFEYSRQSLICLADSNLEDMNCTNGGVSGWQSERTCKNFEQLRSWADKWGISKEEALHDFGSQVNFGTDIQ